MARDYYDDDQRRYQGRQLAEDRSGLAQNHNDRSGGRPSTFGQGRGYERQQSADNRQAAYGGDQFRGHYGDETGQGSAYVGERNYGDAQGNGGRSDSGEFQSQQRYQGQSSFGEDRQRQQGGYGSGGYDRYQGGRDQHQNFASRGEQQGSGGGYGGARNGGSQGEQQRGHRDPDYHQWREEQLRNLDRDYESWRQERYQQFSNDFNTWRSNRGGPAEQQNGQQQQKAGGAIHATPGASDAGGAVGSSATSASSGKSK